MSTNKQSIYISIKLFTLNPKNKINTNKKNLTSRGIASVLESPGSSLTNEWSQFRSWSPNFLLLSLPKLLLPSSPPSVSRFFKSRVTESTDALTSRWLDSIFTTPPPPVLARHAKERLVVRGRGRNFRKEEGYNGNLGRRWQREEAAAAEEESEEGSFGEKWERKKSIVCFVVKNK